MGRREPGFADVHGMHVRGYFLCLILKHGACSRHTFTCAKLREPCSNGDPSIHNIFSLRTGRTAAVMSQGKRQTPTLPSPSLPNTRTSRTIKGIQSGFFNLCIVAAVLCGDYGQIAALWRPHVELQRAICCTLPNSVNSFFMRCLS